MARPQQGSKRLRKRVEVLYGKDRPRFIGYSRNVSRAGIMVGSTRVYAPGTVLQLQVKLPSGTFRLQGVVIWAREGSVQWLASGRIGMGIVLIRPPEGFLDTLQTEAARPAA